MTDFLIIRDQTGFPANSLRLPCQSPAIREKISVMFARYSPYPLGGESISSNFRAVSDSAILIYPPTSQGAGAVRT